MRRHHEELSVLPVLVPAAVVATRWIIGVVVSRKGGGK